LEQQRPIESKGNFVNIDLGSEYAKQLGLGEFEEFDGTSLADETKTSTGPGGSKEEDNAGKTTGGKKKKKKKKK
jgi:hypothetical protein